MASPPFDSSPRSYPDPWQRRVWAMVSSSPLRSLWDLQGIPARVIVHRTFKAFLADNLLGRAAELGFYFLFALFPTLVSASSVLGLAARSASRIYDNLLTYLSVLIPHSAMGIVLETFNQTTAASSSGKITFGLAAALWSASVGFSAIQDTLNTVYKVPETRPYWKARLSAIAVTLLLAVLVTLLLASMLGGDFFAAIARHRIAHRSLALLAAAACRTIGWALATALLILIFAVIYYFAPDVKASRWRWLSPGAAVGIVTWLLASFGLRIYLYFFNNYSVTYGSLGAVIILLMWFYITGLMLLLGAELNSEIEAAATEKRLLELEQRRPFVTAEAIRPVPNLPAADQPGGQQDKRSA
jgi:membrane protein